MVVVTVVAAMEWPPRMPPYDTQLSLQQRLNQVNYKQFPEFEQCSLKLGCGVVQQWGMSGVLYNYRRQP